MPMVRFRLIGSRANADDVIATLHGLDRIEHVEEIDDLVSGMREDSSSSDSVSDSEGHVYSIEVDAPGDTVADDVRARAEEAANECGAGIEFVDEF